MCRKMMVVQNYKSQLYETDMEVNMFCDIGQLQLIMQTVVVVLQEWFLVRQMLCSAFKRHLFQ